MAHSYIGMDKVVDDMISAFFAKLFPNFYSFSNSLSSFEESIEASLAFVISKNTDIANISSSLSQQLINIKTAIYTDVQAAYDNDPAAKSQDEIILTYPGFKAISIYRLAHELYKLDVPIVPRMLTEKMHSLTGIDIHPGAEIDDYFFIDHGTGIVIGETTIIGKHVNIYQNVTLGVKNFKKQENGLLVKQGKRHPNIGDNVTIYAGATILGGDTFIGENTIIGSGTWITRSVPNDTVIVNQNSTY